MEMKTDVGNFRTVKLTSFQGLSKSSTLVDHFK